MKGQQIQLLKQILAPERQLELAFLIGSRATGHATGSSDWDIALQWQRDLPFMKKLALTERLRNRLAKALKTDEKAIDLIDIPSSGLAMRDVIASEGVLLKGDNTLPLSRFLLRTWRELEDHYWRKEHAA